MSLPLKPTAYAECGLLPLDVPRPSDHRSLAGEPIAAAVGVLAMVRLVLHGLGRPGMGQLLIGVLGLVVLPGGIGLIGLVAHGLSVPRHSRDKR